MPHYTSASQNALIERIMSDFIGQIARQLEKSGMSQSDLAQKLDVSEGDVSQVINLNRINLTLKVMARYASASGLKLAVVAYDDGDPNNEKGPIGSEILALAWEKLGKPRSLSSIMENFRTVASNYASRVVPVPFWNGWMNSTFVSSQGHSNTAGQFREYVKEKEIGKTVYA